jgi:2-methylisocitrate lyase-like PEP mutase family enzyme
LGTIMTQQAKADLFRQLHNGPDVLVLPNAWDVASARIFEQAGYRAIATTSAGIAAVLGYPDGQRISRSLMVEAVERIAHGVALPVTADMEAGYGATVEVVADTARAVLAAGAIGMNFEDATDRPDAPLMDIASQVERIRAIRAVAAEKGIALVLNARTDVYLLGIGDPESRFEEAVRRANDYRQAGADCLFIPGVSDAATIGRLVKAIGGPINILAVSGTPPIAELARLGVARVSLGSGPMRATLALVRRIARELMEQGTYTAFTESAIPYAEVNRLFER